MIDLPLLARDLWPFRRHVFFKVMGCVFWISFASNCFAQPVPAKNEPAHGTVTVVLANQHGLVAVTDSRLSNRGIPLGSGKKLFQIDDHTICTVAGWFGVPGPTTASETTPLRASIPAFFNSLILSNTDALSKLAIDEKRQSLVRVIASSIETADEISLLSHSPLGESESQLILAEVDSGSSN